MSPQLDAAHSDCIPSLHPYKFSNVCIDIYKKSLLSVCNCLLMWKTDCKPSWLDWRLFIRFRGIKMIIIKNTSCAAQHVIAAQHCFEAKMLWLWVASLSYWCAVRFLESSIQSSSNIIHVFQQSVHLNNAVKHKSNLFISMMWNERMLICKLKFNSDTKKKECNCFSNMFFLPAW